MVGRSDNGDGILPARIAAINSGAATARRLLTAGDDACARHWATLEDADRKRALELCTDLENQGVSLMLRGEPDWPRGLERLRTPPAYLFTWGNRELLTQPAVGMCGSRNASPRGLQAASDCGASVASRGWHVVSGYARGVDCETHLGALRASGGTVVVLAEGICHFRRKRIFNDVPFSASNVLVLSQFPPTQRWTAGAAMTRNGLIITLGSALLVIEAGERGGTLAAGQQALRLGLPVLALEYADGPRPGNRMLIAAGAHAVATPRELASSLAQLDGSPEPSGRLAGL